MVRPTVGGGEAVAMGSGKSCAMAVVAALVLAVGSPANQAFAYSATGDRLFPATISAAADRAWRRVLHQHRYPSTDAQRDWYAEPQHHV